METNSLISCICITQKRVPQLARTIMCFLNQTHTHKELVILFEAKDTETGKYAIEGPYAKHPLIKWLRVNKPEDMYLGQLRNYAIERATGKFICQWDDDDWYHPEKLSFQLTELIENKTLANVLGYEIIYDAVARNSYLSCLRYWEGTLLCYRELALSNPYPNLKRGEDTPVIKALLDKRAIHLSRLITPLYIYTYHGSNTWDYNHFSGFFPYCKLLPEEINTAIESVMDDYTDSSKIRLLNELFKDQFKSENRKINTAHNTFNG